MFKIHLTALLVLFTGCAPANSVRRPQLLLFHGKIEPVAEVSGRVYLEAFPRADYEGLGVGDRPELRWILHLDHPIVAQGEPGHDFLVGRIEDLRRVQLILPEGMNQRLEPDQKVRFKGSFFVAHTAHHVTPVVMQVEAISNTAGGTPAIQ